MRSSQPDASNGFDRSPIKVTFDTNTLAGVVDPDQAAGDAEHSAYQAVHSAVKAGQIRGFFSEALVTLDAIGRKAKAEVLGAARIVSETSSTGPNQITIKVGPRWKPIILNPQILARLETALALGMRALIGPRRFGDTLVVRGFGEEFYEPYPCGEAFGAAVNATNAFDATVVARGLGRACVIQLSKSFSERDGAAGEWWPQGLERTRSAAERKKVRQAVNEWADGEALAAHVGYRNDLFCTRDHGSDLKERSLLHPVHHAWLAESYGITFVKVSELAARLATP